MTGADIATIVNAAAMAAIKEQVSAGKKGKLEVTMAHFENALQKITKKSKVAGRTTSLA